MDPDRNVWLHCIGGKLIPVTLTAQDKVSTLRQLACEHMNCEQATLVANGASLCCSDDNFTIGDVLGSNGTVLAAPVRKAVKMKLSNDAGSMLLGHSAAHTNFGDAESNEADPMGDDPAIPPKDASPMQLRIGSWMEQSKLPSAFLAVFYLLSLKQWSVMGLWILGGPLVAAHGFGAVYVGASLVLLICMNLGRRKAGEASAYSVFNEDFRRLPGDFSDEQVNNAFRGRM